MFKNLISYFRFKEKKKKEKDKIENFENITVAIV